MIKFENLNLLEADVDYICHQVNCQGAMNSGVAKAIREKWPIVFTEYDKRVYKFENCSKMLLGTIQILPVNTKINVINLFAQFNYGYDGKRYTSYDAFNHCLSEIKWIVPKGSKIAFPYRIGCDRGGADWEVIFAMIKSQLSDYDITFCYLTSDDYILNIKGENK